MPCHRINLTAASAGGTKPLHQTAGSLPAVLSAAVVVAVDKSAHSRGPFPGILTRTGLPTAVQPRSGAEIQPDRRCLAGHVVERENVLSRSLRALSERASRTAGLGGHFEGEQAERWRTEARNRQARADGFRPLPEEAAVFARD